MLFVGIGVYNWIGVGNIVSMTAMRPEEILSFGLGLGFKLLAIILAYALISVVIESGLLNMYKKAVLGGTEAGDFGEGISKYFLKLLLGEVLIILCCILALPFYLILGIVSLTVGLTVIPLVAGVFLTMWKVSLVMNDTGIFEALKDSFRFAKRNFIPLTVLQIIHWAFSKGATGGGGGGGGSNFNYSNTSNYGNNFDPGFGNNFVGVPGMEEVIRIVKLVVAILLPIVSIAIIAGSVIAMIFEVFFSLALFVAYKNDFKVEETHLLIEEPSPEESVEAIDSALEDASIVDEVTVQTNEVETTDKEVEQ
jgi:hypothetical protein